MCAPSPRGRVATDLLLCLLLPPTCSIQRGGMPTRAAAGGRVALAGAGLFTNLDRLSNECRMVHADLKREGARAVCRPWEGRQPPDRATPRHLPLAEQHGRRMVGQASSAFLGSTACANSCSSPTLPLIPPPAAANIAMQVQVGGGLEVRLLDVGLAQDLECEEGDSPEDLLSWAKRGEG